MRANEHRREDLLCPQLERMHVRSTWAHQNKRNRSRFPAHCLAHCTSAAVRVSRRLLLHAVEEMQRQQSFCEMRMPNLCRALPWCTMADVVVGYEEWFGPFHAQGDIVPRNDPIFQRNRTLLVHRTT